MRDFINHMGWNRFTVYRGIAWMVGLAMFLLLMHEPLTIWGPWVHDVGLEVANTFLVLITIACLAAGWAVYVAVWALFSGLDMTVGAWIRNR